MSFGPVFWAAIGAETFGGCSLLPMPGRKKVAGETLFVADMPPQPLIAKTSGNKAASLGTVQNEFTIFIIVWTYPIATPIFQGINPKANSMSSTRKE